MSGKPGGIGQVQCATDEVKEIAEKVYAAKLCPYHNRMRKTAHSPLRCGYVGSAGGGGKDKPTLHRV